MSLLDLHLHGAFGVDVQTAEGAGLDRLALGLSQRGISGFLPTLVPLPLPDLFAAVDRLSSWIRSRREGDGRGAMPLGIHFEGPFVSPSRGGALNAPAFLDGRDRKRLDAFLDATANVPGRLMVTLAPEIPGGLDVVSLLVKKGWVVSIGHTDAEARTLDEALARGAKHMTHFCNAMRPFHHREPGPVGWGLLRDGVTVDLICDLVHLHPDTIRLVLKAKGASRVALISDAIPPAGLPDGDYSVWGETLTVRFGSVRNAAGALAGSVSLLPEGVANLIALGVPEADAEACASTVPRKILAS